MSVVSVGIFEQKLRRKEKQDAARKEVNRRAAEKARERKRMRRRRDRAEWRHVTRGILCVAAKPDPALLAQLLKQIPQYDLRSLTAQVFGDPPPGRSALDQRRHG